MIHKSVLVNLLIHSLRYEDCETIEGTYYIQYHVDSSGDEWRLWIYPDNMILNIFQQTENLLISIHLCNTYFIVYGLYQMNDDEKTNRE